MAHKKGAGSSRNGRDSKSKRLGIKRFGGELVISGNILVRQRGNKFYPGPGTGIGRDYTIFATQEGYVTFEWIRGGRKQIAVRPEPLPQTAESAQANGSPAAPAKKPAMPKPEARTKAPVAVATAPTGASDELTKIEGIGPKISGALKAAGVDTFAKLAEASEADLTAALESAGLRFAPSLHTWARQATFAAQGDWDGLKELQDHLVSGRDPDEKH